MFSFGYRDRRWIIFKDICFALVCGYLISRGSLIAIIVGVLGLAWYGRDLYYQIRAAVAERRGRRQEKQQPNPGDAPQGDDRITLTSGAKEVDFEKE